MRKTAIKKSRLENVLSPLNVKTEQKISTFQELLTPKGKKPEKTRKQVVMCLKDLVKGKWVPLNNEKQRGFVWENTEKERLWVSTITTVNTMDLPEFKIGEDINNPGIIYGPDGNNRATVHFRILNDIIKVPYKGELKKFSELPQEEQYRINHLPMKVEWICDEMSALDNALRLSNIPGVHETKSRQRDALGGGLLVTKNEIVKRSVASKIFVPVKGTDTEKIRQQIEFLMTFHLQTKLEEDPDKLGKFLYFLNLDNNDKTIEKLYKERPKESVDKDLVEKVLKSFARFKDWFSDRPKKDQKLNTHWLYPLYVIEIVLGLYKFWNEDGDVLGDILFKKWISCCFSDFRKEPKKIAGERNGYFISGKNLGLVNSWLEFFFKYTSEQGIKFRYMGGYADVNPPLTFWNKDLRISQVKVGNWIS
jgi:hypothetical protein